jgi:hypothetical protein
MGRLAVLSVFVALLSWGALATLGEARDLEDVLEDLGSASAAERESAVTELVQGGSSSLPTLLAEVRDARSPLVQAGLAEAAAKIGVGASQEAAIVALLSSKTPSTRSAGVRILASKPGLGRVALTNLAKSSAEVPFLRASAAAALGGDLQSRSALKGLLAAKDTPAMVRAATIRSLARTGEDGVKDVRDLALSSQTSAQERRAAVLALEQGGVDSRAALRAIVSGGSASIRPHAIAALATKGTSDDLEDLLEWTSEEDATVRLEALRTLLHLGGGASNRSAVASLLSDADVRVRILATQFFRKDSEALAEGTQSSLRGLLEDGNAHLRYEAALALHAHGDDTGKDVMKADRDASDGDAGHRRRAGTAYSLITGGND